MDGIEGQDKVLREKADAPGVYIYRFMGGPEMIEPTKRQGRLRPASFAV